jgi:hypothetical protein
MFHGRVLSTEVPGLVPFVRELDDRVAVAFPDFVDGTAEQRLRLVPDQITGRGVELADDASVTRDTPLAIYAGSVVLDVPSSDYVLALPPFHLRRCQPPPHGRGSLPHQRGPAGTHLPQRDGAPVPSAEPP